ncbi:MAG: hypothetical protein ACI8RD_005233 [Bacillariaceae sp.]|jgi:hypothetical protein
MEWCDVYLALTAWVSVQILNKLSVLEGSKEALTLAGLWLERTSVAGSIGCSVCAKKGPAGRHGVVPEVQLGNVVPSIFEVESMYSW